jgi:tetratricopeptide (TPR) repeat protein
MAKAKECFEQSIAIDPNYAPPYSGLAEYFYALAGLGIKPLAEMAPLARSAAGKALAIDPANSEAHSVLGAMAAFCDYDWEMAKKHHRKALAATPVPTSTRHRYVQFYLLPQGRISDAMEQSRLALETDPLSMSLHFCLTGALYMARRYAETIDHIRKALDIDANFYLVWATIGLAQLHSGLTQDAIVSLKRTVELAPWFDMGRAYLTAALYDENNRASTIDFARKLQSSRGLNMGAAVCYAVAGETDAMFEALEAAWHKREWYLLFAQNPFFDPYLDDPRFKALRRRMNLEATQSQSAKN